MAQPLGFTALAGISQPICLCPRIAHVKERNGGRGGGSSGILA